MISPIEQQDLSIDAQFLMSPQGRPRVLPDQQKGKPAAVAIAILNGKNEPYIPLIQRPEYEGTHSAQISFPGGKPELEDHDLHDTAKRECLEEIGLNLNQPIIQPLGGISPLFIPPSQFWVHPFVFYSDDDFTLIPQESEVDRIIHLPIHKLLDNSITGRHEVALRNGSKIPVPVFQYDGAVIWGATAMMLSEFQHILKTKLA